MPKAKVAKKVVKKKDPGGMRFIHVVPLEKDGVIEFKAWEGARWLGIWKKPWNDRTTIPHLAFLDCPSGRQTTWRLLILEGQAQMPIDEKGEEWSYLGLQIWETRRSFGSLWMSTYCQSKSSEMKRGSLPARLVLPKALGKPAIEVPEEEELLAP
jgi:hypothetical protein